MAKIDLEIGKSQLGLGPENLELLGLHKEDVGMREPIIITDYSSPPDLNNRYGGANLTTEEVQRVRAACIRDSHQKWRKPKKRIETENYYVEFPEEDEEGNTSATLQLDSGTEAALALNMGDGMSLKMRKMLI